MSVRELVVASAGAGKTYRISSRIIGLLAEGEAPRSILASTFTRKAAGEILDRVLLRLAQAATDSGAARELAKAALAEEDRAAADSAYWRGVLRRTVDDLNLLSIGTLDSFFVSAVKSFTHDLGLPAGWGIADKPVEERIRAEALDALLSNTGIPNPRSLFASSMRCTREVPAVRSTTRWPA
jgi:ATP-dependent exoDNAse (exonuclease V) beta subunit